ncbi:YHS domain-containing (seleno)protein [Novosphingobium sp.]|uniref:YHS domain-containing (seleno)protein n=1 Tax=Novosphingobium sp. TaxID=1874826 RepID=UPI003BA8D22D
MITRTSRSLLAALGLVVAATAIPSTPAFAVVDDSTAAVNTDQQGIALHGYDPVAYFTAGAPAKGSTKFTATYDGARYYFASAENLHKFQANPAAFAPQYGGFCAMGVALHKKLDGDPNVWKIVDGKLYLNVNADVSVAWQRDIPGNLAKANEEWPTIKNATPASLN